ncbi:hypothetical protein BsWGS_28499 [Bradybaena similaris]
MHAATSSLNKEMGCLHACSHQQPKQRDGLPPCMQPPADGRHWCLTASLPVTSKCGCRSEVIRDRSEVIRDRSKVIRNRSQVIRDRAHLLCASEVWKPFWKVHRGLNFKLGRPGSLNKGK